MERTNFKNQMKEDIKKIGFSANVFMAADKTK